MQKNLHISKKSSTFAPELKEIEFYILTIRFNSQLLTIKNSHIMTTKDYFETELHVHFTCNELNTIMHALAEFSFQEENANHHFNSENAWSLRDKVKKFVNLYDYRAVL